jgi:hypothetical protein
MTTPLSLSFLTSPNAASEQEKLDALMQKYKTHPMAHEYVQLFIKISHFYGYHYTHDSRHLVRGVKHRMWDRLDTHFTKTYHPDFLECVPFELLTPEQTEQLKELIDEYFAFIEIFNTIEQESKEASDMLFEASIVQHNVPDIPVFILFTISLVVAFCRQPNYDLGKMKQLSIIMHIISRKYKYDLFFVSAVSLFLSKFYKNPFILNNLCECVHNIIYGTREIRCIATSFVPSLIFGLNYYKNNTKKQKMILDVLTTIGNKTKGLPKLIYSESIIRTIYAYYVYCNFFPLVKEILATHPDDHKLVRHYLQAVVSSIDCPGAAKEYTSSIGYFELMKDVMEFYEDENILKLALQIIFLLALREVNKERFMQVFNLDYFVPIMNKYLENRDIIMAVVRIIANIGFDKRKQEYFPSCRQRKICDPEPHECVPTEETRPREYNMYASVDGILRERSPSFDAENAYYEAAIAAGIPNMKFPTTEREEEKSNYMIERVNALGLKNVYNWVVRAGVEAAIYGKPYRFGSDAPCECSKADATACYCNMGRHNFSEAKKMILPVRPGDNITTLLGYLTTRETKKADNAVWELAIYSIQNIAVNYPEMVDMLHRSGTIQELCQIFSSEPMNKVLTETLHIVHKFLPTPVDTIVQLLNNVVTNPLLVQNIMCIANRKKYNAVLLENGAIPILLSLLTTHHNDGNKRMYDETWLCLKVLALYYNPGPDDHIFGCSAEIDMTMLEHDKTVKGSDYKLCELTNLIGSFGMCIHYNIPIDMTVSSLQYNWQTTNELAFRMFACCGVTFPDQVLPHMRRLFDEYPYCIPSYKQIVAEHDAAQIRVRRTVLTMTEATFAWQDDTDRTLLGQYAVAHAVKGFLC